MTGLKAFVRAALFGGIIVLLPLGILLFILNWIIGAVTGTVQPISNQLTATLNFNETLSDVIAVASLIVICFLVGAAVKTEAGEWLFRSIENRILKVAPGYSMIRETVVQFLGTERPPFSSVALVQIFQNRTLVTAFITDTHADGSYSVFVPTGPNPMSGNIYHVKGEYVHIVDVPVEDAMRSIISCGAGSKKLIDAYMDENAQLP